MKIALDVMGGDYAPANPIGGVKLALAELTDIEKIYLVGQEDRIQAQEGDHAMRHRPGGGFRHFFQTQRSSQALVTGDQRTRRAEYV